MRLILVLTFVLCAWGCKSRTPQILFPRSNVALRLQEQSNALDVLISRANNVIQRFTLDPAFTKAEVQYTSNGFRLSGDNNKEINFELITDESEFSLVRVSRNLTRGQSAKDCLNLDIGQKSWFGGPENHDQFWPIEKASFSDFSYVTKEAQNTAITERYWLNSEGVLIFVEDKTPLFIDQNSQGHENKLCFSAHKDLPYDTRENGFSFNYQIGVAANAKVAHMHAIKHFLGKPSGYPDERMVRHPIWSTWAIYKTEINESVVMEFADEILKHEFNNSQLEIDDDWEICYGALTFRQSKFSNIRSLTDALKQKGFRVTLWIHPFINKNCEQWYNEAMQNGYLVLNHEGNPDTQWWDSTLNQAAYIDFTNPDAAKWYSDRLTRLQEEDGIDSFKFDAGESSWSPPDPVLRGSQEISPSQITTEYIRTVAKFGPMVEVRSGQGNQAAPIFFRMIDKDSEWGWNNGLVTLVTTLLQMNLAGYPFVLPDMIGGNGYNNHPPNKELFIRWLQANVFMPSLQFSYVPWNFDQETIDISLTMTKLHDNYTAKIMERFQLAVQRGDPVNPPLWWADPEDRVAQQIYDQFLLGDDIIAAPVLEMSKVERDIYLPKGQWRDGNTGETHIGPKWIMKYPAPLKVLPYFVRA